MRKHPTSVATRLEDEDFRELPLRPSPEPHRPLPVRPRSTSDRIKDALRRWLEQEM
jgi:hypothetical protein